MKRQDFLKITGLASLGSLFYGMKNINELYKEATTWKNTPRMPVLFLGHGSPMNAIEDNKYVQGFKNIAKKLPTPKAVLCISAHWETKGTKVTAMDMPKTIHDFGGFPQALFDVQYPAEGSPELAKTITSELLPEVELDHEWGLDHGAWSVIIHLFPEANVPVIQMSLDYKKSPEQHYELAKKLNMLRHKGVLIVGSGNIVHNLRYMNFNGGNYDWALEAKETVNKYISARDYKSLFSYEKSNALRMAIPTPDHYLPLIYSLALEDTSKDEVYLFNDEVVMGSISMTSLYIG